MRKKLFNVLIIAVMLGIWMQSGSTPNYRAFHIDSLPIESKATILTKDTYLNYVSEYKECMSCAGVKECSNEDIKLLVRLKMLVIYEQRIKSTCEWTLVPEKNLRTIRPYLNKMMEIKDDTPIIFALYKDGLLYVRALRCPDCIVENKYNDYVKGFWVRFPVNMVINVRERLAVASGDGVENGPVKVDKMLKKTIYRDVLSFK